MSPRGERGVTLIELITVVGIISLLAAIGYPAYMSFTQRGNRSDATGTLTRLAQALERCYSEAFTYVGCAAVPVGAQVSPNGHYTITVAVPAVSQFTVTATPLSAAQRGDNQCQSFTLASGGGQSARDSGGADATRVCWGSN